MTIKDEIVYRPASIADLSGQTALVTGGTRGIGKGIVHALANAGARAIVVGRDEAVAKNVVAEIEESGGKAGYIVTDLFDDAAVDGLIGAAISKFGKLDILVNNAGIDADAPAMGYPLESFRRVIRFNLELPFRLSVLAAEHFVQHGRGVIINMASVLGFVATPEAVSYVAAKHGLIGLTKNLAIEWGKRGVRVNAIAPGLIQTDMTSTVWSSAHGQDYVKRRIPVGRIGQPQDIGGAVVFLSSAAADFIHGETIAIDGGFLAT